MPGQVVFAATVAVAFPVVWLKFVDGSALVCYGLACGFLAGLLSGAGLGLLILMGYQAFGQGLFDRALFIGKMSEIGLGALPAYLGGAAYWILVNSVLEEYAWRWFVYEKCEALATPAIAVILTAFFFTLHHFIALQAYCSLPLAAVCSLGVFLGGAAWSFMYMRYRSIWPGA